MTRTSFLLAAMVAACNADAALLNLVNLEIRENAAFDNAFAFSTGANISATVPDGAGSTSRSSDVTWNTDLDGVGGLDDVVSFTVTGTSNSGNNVSWNAGIGWGATGPFDGSDSLSFTVSGVAVTAGSAAGSPITFDGFVGASAGAYAGAPPGEFDGSLDINGITVSQVWPAAAGFQYVDLRATFPLSNAVTFDNPQINAVDGFAGVLARGLDLQFTVIPEPSTAVLAVLAALGCVGGRRD